MNELNLALALVGGLLLVLGLTSGLLTSRLGVAEPVVALLFGVLVGPTLGILDLGRWGEPTLILEDAARTTLAVALMGVALRLKLSYVRAHARPLALLLGVVMPLMWLTSGLLAYLILGLSPWLALLIGAVVTPTDPVVASTIVSGSVAEKNLPGRLRNLLSAESGANDALAAPLVLLCLLFLTHPPEAALTHWLTQTLLWETLGGVALGLAFGAATGYALNRAEREPGISVSSLLTVSLALSLTTLGAVKLLGGNGVLAVFVAGLTFAQLLSRREDLEQERLQEAITRFFNLPVFVLLGAALPWRAWLDLGWSGPLLVVAVLLLRRLPTVLALHSTLPLHGLRDALFFGWFGPIGVSAVFYATFSLRETHAEIVWTVGSLAVAASVLVHGLSAMPLTRVYGRTRAAHGKGDEDTDSGSKWY